MQDKYYCFPPHNPRFFFPVRKDLLHIVSDFYRPYSGKAKIIYKLWLNIKWLRELRTFRLKEIPVSVAELQKVIPVDNYYLAFNIGTAGEERKSSVMAIGRKSLIPSFLVKLAVTEIAKKNLLNEIKVVTELSKTGFKFAPGIDKSFLSDTSVVGAFEFLQGEVYNNLQLTQALIDLLFKIAEAKEVSAKADNLLFSFGHGDFCCWNIIAQENTLKLYDWEMAGDYPLGYDLFTFIYQQRFLLNKNFKKIAQQEKKLICTYFSYWDINNYQPYLLKFIEIKLAKEQGKANDFLFKKFNLLAKYVRGKKAESFDIRLCM